MPQPSSPVRGIPAWARRPALPVALLAAAVAVSVAHGQPPPVDRPSGVSVSLSSDARMPPEIGTVLLVSSGGVVRFDTDSRTGVRLPMPRGVVALRVWAVGGLEVALGRLPYPPSGKLPVGDRAWEWPSGTATAERTAAYLLRTDRPPVPLGAADTVVPSTDGRTVWLASDGIATRLALGPDQRRITVPLPRPARLVADTPHGLVVTTGTVQTGDQAPKPGPRPTATPIAPTPTYLPPTSPAGAAGGLAGRASGTPAPATTPLAAGAAAATPAATTAGSTATAGLSPGASPAEPSSVPLATLLVQAGGLTRYLAAAEALAAFGDTVLVRRADDRLGVITLHGAARAAHWLPKLSAVEATGPAAVDYDGRTFAVLARVNEHARLMVGPIGAQTEAQLNVVALDGGPPSEDAVPPAFTASGRVLAVRPDGKVAYYLSGNRQGELLGDDLPPATAVVQG